MLSMLLKLTPRLHRQQKVLRIQTQVPACAGMYKQHLLNPWLRNSWLSRLVPTHTNQVVPGGQNHRQVGQLPVSSSWQQLHWLLVKLATDMKFHECNSLTKFLKHDT